MNKVIILITFVFCLQSNVLGWNMGLFIKRGSVPTSTPNKYSINFSWNNGYKDKMVIKSKEEIVKYFSEHPELKLDEESFKYVLYEGKMQIESFEYYGQLNEVKEKIEKQEEKSLAKAKKLINTATSADGITFVVNNSIYNGTNRKYYPNINVSYEYINKALDELGFSLIEYKTQKHVTKECNTYPCVEEYYTFVSNFSYSKKEDYEKISCTNELNKLFTHSVMDLCPKWKESQIIEIYNRCKKCNMEENVSDKFYEQVPLCLTRENFVRLFPNSRYTPTVQKQIDDIKKGKRKDEREVVSNYIAETVTETKQDVKDLMNSEYTFETDNNKDYSKNTEKNNSGNKNKSTTPESKNKKIIEFKEIKTNNENCGDFSYRLFDVYKNGKNYKTLKVVSHNDEWWSSCPFDCTFCRKLPKTKYSLKQFLIFCQEGDDGKADNYTLTEL